jgi:argininosuccinate lyase
LIHDLRATRAHVHGLVRIGVLSEEDGQSLEAALDELGRSFQRGELVLGPDDEDCHSAIEAALVAALGEVGKKVHTGRSRNDQVLVALRLYQRDAIDTIVGAARGAALALLDAAEAEALTPMPGYTHLRRAVPSSVGLWLGSVAESIADAIDALGAARAFGGACPLGAAAGYGVNLPLDRDGVAAELGFERVADNPMSSQASRGLVEVQVCVACWQLLAVVRRFAWDLSLFGSAEFGFLALDDGLTTGSSIMPNKKNPDVVELMRGACAVVQGAIAELMGVLSLPSGYHRDLQLTKAPLMRAIDETLATVRMVPPVVAGLRFDRRAMRAAIDPGCFATDRAVELTAEGVPFRDAYRQVAAELGSLAAGDPEASLRARTSPGAPGAPRHQALRRRLAGA